MADYKALLLVIEDEAPIRRFLKAALEGAAFKTLEASTGTEGLSLAASHHPDLVLLDLGLPDMEGLTVLRKLRAWYERPVLILSARGQERDKIQGLESGADDYLSKPFSIGELTARLKALLRRKSAGSGANEKPFRAGNLRVDLNAHVVRLGGKVLHITPNEFRILAFLIRNAGKLVTHDQLIRELWGSTHEDVGPSLRVYVHQLRQKIEKDPARPKHIFTEPGVGYRLKED